MWAIQLTLVVQLSLRASSNFCLNCLSASSSLFPKARESWQWKRKMWFYVFSVGRCKPQSLKKAGSAIQCTPCSYSNTIYRRENEHQGMVIIWPLPNGYRRWNEFTITARQLFSFLLPPLKGKWFYSISFEHLDETGRQNWALCLQGPNYKERDLYLKILYILDWGELRKPCSQHQCKQRDEEIPMPA